MVEWLKIYLHQDLLHPQAFRLVAWGLMAAMEVELPMLPETEGRLVEGTLPRERVSSHRARKGLRMTGIARMRHGTGLMSSSQIETG
jgi:hypothetical protein